MTRSTFPTAAIYLGAGKQALSGSVTAFVKRVVVDQSANLPGSLEIWISNADDTVLQSSGIEIGELVTVRAPVPDSARQELLLTAEVTSIAGDYRGLVSHIVVRGYSREHRLQRVRRSRAYLNMKDSDIAREVAGAAKLAVGEVDQSKIAHAHLAQVNETDWDFLQRRAAEIGFQVRMIDDRFCFQKAPATRPGPAIKLSRGGELWSFAPRLTAANLPPQVEVRVWDATGRKAVAEVAPLSSDYASLRGHSAATLAGLFTATTITGAPSKPNPALGELGPATERGYVLVDHPAAGGAAATAAATEVAAALAQRVAATAAEAEGDAGGDPRIQPGAVLDIDGFASIFNGSWTVTGARHVFDMDEGGYRTYFSVHGREDRSMTGLLTGGGTHDPQFAGVVCAVVTNNNDPDKRARVKVSLPWLSPDFETDWAPVTQVSSGPGAGAMFLPAVGDQVLVGFEFGDPRRPYVLGSMLTSSSKYDAGGPAIKAAGESTQVVRSGFASATGNLVAFYDDLPAPGSPPNASQLLLGAKDSTVAIAFDQVEGTVTLSCKPAAPNSKNPAGSIVIECGDAGKIDIRTGAGGSVNIDGGNELSLTAKSELKIECNGPVQIKGNPIQLN